jgi:electron transport complex protein RnfB
MKPEETKDTADTDRRDFLKKTMRGVALLGLGTIAGLVTGRTVPDDKVWQIDPEKCTQCGQCATHCVLNLSAVKCVHSYAVCGYCNLCGGYLQPHAVSLDTAAENQLCPTGAIKRRYVEDVFYEYTIEEKLCIGCSKCVKGCSAFGNGSLYLQVRHDVCANCNECAIARACPSDAFYRASLKRPYRFKHDKNKQG